MELSDHVSIHYPLFSAIPLSSMYVSTTMSLHVCVMSLFFGHPFFSLSPRNLLSSIFNSTVFLVLCPIQDSLLFKNIIQYPYVYPVLKNVPT